MSGRYRIDDLARHAGSTVRNVRSYQEKGLLAPPVREGRAAYYDDAHLARLRTIAALLARGYSLQNIAELLASWEDGQEIGDVLGLEDALTSPFSDEEPAVVDLEELARLYGTMDPTVLGRGIQVGLVEPSEVPGKLRVPSMHLLRAGAELHEVGIPIEVLFGEIQRLRTDVGKIAERLVRVVVEHVIAPRLEQGADYPELAEVVRRVRPLAKRIVDAELARALEGHARAALGEQMATRPPPRAKKRRRA